LDSTSDNGRELINAQLQGGEQSQNIQQPQPQQAGQQAQQEMVFLGSLLAFLSRTKPWPRQQVEQVLGGVEVYATADGKVIFVYNGRRTHPIDPRLLPREESTLYILEGAFRHLFQDEDRVRIASVITHYALNRVLLRNSVKNATLKEEAEEKVSREDLIHMLETRLLEEFTVNEKRTIRTFYTMQRQKIYQMGLYCWQEEGGYYIQCEPLIKQRLREIAEELGTTHYKKTTRDVINEVLDRITAKTMEELTIHPMKISFKNIAVDFGRIEEFATTGGIKLLENAVLEPDPDVIAFNHVPHRLPPEAWQEVVARLREARLPVAVNIEELAMRYCPKALEVFKAWSPTQWETLFEVVGFMMSPRYFPAKIVVLVGSGGNGKTTFIRLLERVLGRENVTQVPLHELLYDKFAPGDLMHKLANLVDDLDPKPLRNAGAIKKLTGEGFVCSDRKYRDRVCFHATAKHLFTANQLPKEVENTPAFWRRILVVEFPNRFQENPGFVEKAFTEPEIEGLILVSLVAYMQVLWRGDFSTNTARLWRWLAEVAEDSARAFIRGLFNWELCGDFGYVAVIHPPKPQAPEDAELLKELLKQSIKGPEELERLFKALEHAQTRGEPKTGLQRLYGLYRRFCEMYGVEPASMQDFSRALEEELARELASGKIKRYMKEGRVYFKGVEVAPCPWRFREPY